MDTLVNIVVMTIIIGFKILLCALCASIMQAKGRSWWIGVILGLLFNVFGVLVVMLLKPTAEVAAKQLQRGIFKECPNCTYHIKVDATVCHFCHSVLSEPLVDQPSPQRLYASILYSGKGQYTCSECSTTVPLTATTCPSCAQTFAGATA